MLSQVTRLLALVSAPPLEAATVRHVDVLQLQPRRSYGRRDHVDRRRRRSSAISSPSPSTPASSPGPATTCASGSSASGSGRACSRSASTSRACRRASGRSSRRSEVPSTRSRTSASSTSAAPPACSTTCASEEIGAYRSLIDALEKRAALLDVLAQSLGVRRPFARVGDELRAVGAARPRARRRDLRLREPDARHGQPARAAAHGLREGAALGPRGGARAVALRRRGLRGATG